MKDKCDNLKHWHSLHSEQIIRFFEANRLHRMALERRLSQTGVYRSQHQILMYIAKNPNASQKDIAQLHRASTATIAVSLKKLESGGYIKRVVNQQDNRYNQICITDKGQAVITQSIKDFQMVENEMFAGFSETELTQFKDFMDKICGNLEHFLEQEREDRKQNETI